MPQPNQKRVLAPGGGTDYSDPNPWTTTQGSWSQTDWYVDPVKGKDTNSGADVNHPVQTVMGGIVSKWGTPEPILPQTTTIHLMNSQATGAETIVLSPTLTGGNNFIIDGTLGLATIGATFHPSSVTAKSRSGSGTLLQLHGMPAATVAGLLILNVTKQSYSIVDSISAGVAVCAQPLAAAGLTTVSAVPSYSEDDTWAQTDTYQLYKVPSLNLKVFSTSGGDSDSHGTTPTAWLQMINVPDTSGSPGFSTFSPSATSGGQLVLTCCTTDTFFRMEGGLAPFDLFAANCWAPNGAQFTSTNVVGGAYNVNLSANDVLADNIASIDLDTIIHGTLIIKGNPYVILGLVYCDTAISLAHNAVMLIEGDQSPSAQVWGAATLNLEGPLSAVLNATGGTWANCLTISGAITIEGIGTATKYAAGVWTDGINITVANLDTNNGLQNPRTGSRFCTN